MSDVVAGSQRERDKSPLDEALTKNKEATEEVARAADDLAVVHAVLDTKITKGASEGDVKRAVAETKRGGGTPQRVRRKAGTGQRDLRARSAWG